MRLVFIKCLIDSPHHEMETIMSFTCLNLHKKSDSTEDSYIRNPNEETFLFAIENRKHIFVGEFLVEIEKKDKIIKSSSEFGMNDIKYPFA